MSNDHKRIHYIAPLLEWAKADRKSSENLKKSMAKLAKGEIPTRASDEPEPIFKVPSEFNGKDYITMLLHIDAEIEHGLMLQYLYSAYSIGGPQIPVEYRERIQSWQNIILGIAKEEMGHFISIQNVLKVIGAPLNFGRESYPWDIPFYPFPFTLQKFSLKSLAKYVYAEAPADWLESSDPLAVEIVAAVDAQVTDPHTVGALFKVLKQLIKNPEVIPDETFQASTYPYQAKFDEWGRGYKKGDRGSDSGSSYSKSPDLLVAPLMSRDDAYDAINSIAEQGEGEEVADDTPSHFERFLHIYKEYKDILKKTKSLEPARNVAQNPYVGSLEDSTGTPADMPDTKKSEEITNPESILWANLFDIRYRLLLNFLNHSFLLDNGLNSTGSYTPRGMIINSTFGEMYNLKSISQILVQSPLGRDAGKMAGPPFTLPYTFDLPFGEQNRWRMHQDLLAASDNLIEQLKAFKNQVNLKYLEGLREADQKLLQSISTLTAEPA